MYGEPHAGHDHVDTVVTGFGERGTSAITNTADINTAMPLHIVAQVQAENAMPPGKRTWTESRRSSAIGQRLLDDAFFDDGDEMKTAAPQRRASCGADQMLAAPHRVGWVQETKSSRKRLPRAASYAHFRPCGMGTLVSQLSIGCRDRFPRPEPGRLKALSSTLRTKSVTTSNLITQIFRHLLYPEIACHQAPHPRCLC